MKAFLGLTLAAVVLLGGFSLAHSAEKTNPLSASAKEKLIGAWHLDSIDSPGDDGKPNRITGIKGMLIYTRDGHVSVQLMYPKSAASLTNDYVKNGYEASFGTYEVNEEAHTVTHHIEGSITEGLIGKSLPRSFHLTDDGKLIIKSTRPDEHWSVTWEHD